ncbi:MAG: DMT family transporter, partial [Thermoplasmatales archaeon]|nr:DMT family transporter [Thermoplasmatales archaeon]
MDPNLIGETAAIVTAGLWTINSILFASAGKKIGSLSVNAYRILMAVGFLGIAHIIFLGSLLPTASSEQWFWIGLSGIVGLGIGDFGLFAAFVIIGPRRSVLIMSLSPIFAAFGAYLMLGEILSPLIITGIAITLIGVVVVILEKEENSDEKPISKKLKTWGVFLAFIGAIGQGIGLVFAKKGMWLDPSIMMNPLSVAFVRMIMGALFIWTCVVIMRRLPEVRKALKSKKGMGHTAAGAFIGPFIGVTLSMVAVAYTQAGIAQTLMSLMPVFIIPAIWVLYKQKTSWRGVLG